MSVMIFNLRQFQRMAAVLMATTPGHANDSPAIDAMAEVLAVASQANHAAFRATYAERAEAYLARMGDAGRPLSKETLVTALAAPVAALNPEQALSDAELLLYNCADNDGGEYLTVVERLAVERVVALVVDACARLIRTGQREPARFRLIEGGGGQECPGRKREDRLHP